jgi:hypothetical protein
VVASSLTERIRGHIDELFAQDKALPEILEDVARLGAQLLMQAALEAEVTEFLGRDRYQRAVACEDARPGSRNGYREVTPAEPVLAAGGITTEGKPAFIGLAPGTGESADAWHGFLTDLKDRGLPSPLLVISDGAPGLIAAIEQGFPQALRQRCLIQRARNVLAKVRAGMHTEVKDAYWAIFDTEGLKTQPGPRLVELIGHRITEMAAKYSATYPRSDEMPARRPRRAHRLPAVPRHAPPPHPALQLHRAHLRRDPPPHQGHRPAPRRDLLPARPAPLSPRTTPPAPATHRHHHPRRWPPRKCDSPGMSVGDLAGRRAGS